MRLAVNFVALLLFPLLATAEVKYFRGQSYNGNDLQNRQDAATSAKPPEEKTSEKTTAEATTAKKETMKPQSN